MKKIPRWFIDTVKITILLDILLALYYFVTGTTQWILFIPQCLLSFLFLLIYNFAKDRYKKKKIQVKEIEQQRIKEQREKEILMQQKELEDHQKRQQNNQNKQKR